MKCHVCGLPFLRGLLELTPGIDAYRVTLAHDTSTDAVLSGMCSPFTCHCYLSVLPILTQCCGTWQIDPCRCDIAPLVWPPPLCAPYIPGTTDYDSCGGEALHLKTYGDCQEDMSLAVNSKVSFSKKTFSFFFVDCILHSLTFLK